MKPVKQRLVEQLQKNIEDNFYSYHEVDLINDVILYLNKNIIKDDYKDNYYLYNCIHNFREFCLENVCS